MAFLAQIYSILAWLFFKTRQKRQDIYQALTVAINLMTLIGYTIYLASYGVLGGSSDADFTKGSAALSACVM